MASVETIANRLALGTDWLDSSDAARAIGVQPKHLTRDLRPLITHQSRSLKGRGARSVGYAYARADIERLQAIRKALGCPAIRAAQLLHGIRRLGQLGLLEHIESQADMFTVKPRIWLQTGDDAEHGEAEGPVMHYEDTMTWSPDSIYTHDTEYVRADIHSARIAELEAVIAVKPGDPAATAMSFLQKSMYLTRKANERVAELEAERDAARREAGGFRTDLAKMRHANKRNTERADKARAECVGALVDTALINEVNALTSDRDALKRECEGLRGALTELTAIVKGEAPQLLDEDRGGSARLDIEIGRLLSPAEPKENGDG